LKISGRAAWWSRGVVLRLLGELFLEGVKHLQREGLAFLPDINELPDLFLQGKTR
jgi:hypothetical protein